MFNGLRLVVSGLLSKGAQAAYKEDCGKNEERGAFWGEIYALSGGIVYWAPAAKTKVFGPF
jgi:hypothetical protein